MSFVMQWQTRDSIKLGILSLALLFSPILSTVYFKVSNFIRNSKNDLASLAGIPYALCWEASEGINASKNVFKKEEFFSKRFF